MASFDDDGNAQLSQLALFLSGAGQRAKLQQAKTAEMAQQVAPKPQAPAPVSAASPTLVAGGAGPSRIASDLTNQVAKNRFNADGATPDFSSGMTPGGAPKPVASPIPETPENVLHDVPATARRNGLQAQLATPAPTYEQNKPRWWERLGGAAITFGQAMQHNPNAVQMGQNATFNRFNRAQDEWATNQGHTKSQLQEFDTGEEVYDRGQRRQQEMQEFGLRKSTLDRQLHNDTLAEENRRRDDERANKVLSAKEKADAERERADRAREDDRDRRTTALENRALRGPDAPQFSAHERLILRQESKRLGKKVDDMTPDEINRALDGPDKPGGRGAVATFRDAQSIDKYSADMYAKQRDKVRLTKKAEVDMVKAANGSPDEVKAKIAEVENSYNEWSKEFEKQKASWYARVKGGTPVTADEEGKEVTQASAAPSKGDSPSAKPSTSQAATQPQRRTLRGPDGKTFDAEIRNGKWVNAKTGKPL